MLLTEAAQPFLLLGLLLPGFGTFQSLLTSTEEQMQCLLCLPNAYWATVVGTGFQPGTGYLLKSPCTVSFLSGLITASDHL